MRSSKAVFTIAAVSVVAVAMQAAPVSSRSRSMQAASRPQLPMQHLPRPDCFAARGTAPAEDQAASDGVERSRAAEAPTGFDNLTNGFSVQGPPFESLDEDNVVALRSFNDNRFIFEEVEPARDGLGPTYNAQSCRECHQNVERHMAPAAPA